MMHFTEASPVLAVTGMCASYGRIRVVSGVDLSLHQGELVALLGPNGAGKSSLLGGLAGAVQSTGELSLNGEQVNRLPTHLRAARRMAFVPERRGNVFSSMTVAENLEIGLRLSPPEKREAIRSQVIELFPILRQRMHATAGMLSGGEQQMLAIGMALGREPDVLLLDEPSQGLAPVIFDLLENAFETLKRRGIAMLVAEQNLPFAARIADRYIVLSHGEVVAGGGKEDLQKHDDLLSAYLGDEM